MEATIIYWGYIGNNGKENGSYYNMLGHIGIMEKKMEATIIYWGYIGIMEKKMETTMVYCVYTRVILGLYTG